MARIHENIAPAYAQVLARLEALIAFLEDPAVCGFIFRDEVTPEFTQLIKVAPADAPDQFSEIPRHSAALRIKADASGFGYVTDAELVEAIEIMQHCRDYRAEMGA